jgi:hypothetical protein
VASEAAAAIVPSAHGNGDAVLARVIGFSVESTRETHLLLTRLPTYVDFTLVTTSEEIVDMSVAMRGIDPEVCSENAVPWIEEI